MTRHIPVLLKETIQGLYLTKGNIVVDVTAGGGGHTKEILKRVLPGGKVIALDRDEDALQKIRVGASSDITLTQALAHKSLILAHGNYSNLTEILEHLAVRSCDAIVADLGFSSDQIEATERGFSFSVNGPLDMRFDRADKLTAEKIVNVFSVAELTQIFREYGGEQEAVRLARAIERFRKTQPIKTTSVLREIIESAYPKSKVYKMRIHPATKVFQALRIAVNRELEHLGVFLPQALKHLKSGGRLAVITFHSGEDRIVKRFFKNQEKGCVCPPEFPICVCGRKPAIKIITKKPIVPQEKEVKENPRSRSAKLRVAEKL